MGLIEVNEVSKKYIQEESEFRALEHVSLSVEKGGIYLSFGTKRLWKDHAFKRRCRI